MQLTTAVRSRFGNTLLLQENISTSTWNKGNLYRILCINFMKKLLPLNDEIFYFFLPDHVLGLLISIFFFLPPRFARALVGMVMHNPDTNEIAKPSELLASVKTYMSVLQTVENYGTFRFLSFLFFSFCRIFQVLPIAKK